MLRLLLLCCCALLNAAGKHLSSFHRCGRRAPALAFSPGAALGWVLTQLQCQGWRPSPAQDRTAPRSRYGAACIFWLTARRWRRGSADLYRTFVVAVAASMPAHDSVRFLGAMGSSRLATALCGYVCVTPSCLQDDGGDVSNVALARRSARSATRRYCFWRPHYGKHIPPPPARIPRPSASRANALPLRRARLRAAALRAWR